LTTRQPQDPKSHPEIAGIKSPFANDGWRFGSMLDRVQRLRSRAMDINMPEIERREVTKLYLPHEQLGEARLPIIALSLADIRPAIPSGSAAGPAWMRLLTSTARRRLCSRRSMAPMPRVARSRQRPRGGRPRLSRRRRSRRIRATSPFCAGRRRG